MSTCKECIHYEVCQYDGELCDNPDMCKFFKPKSCFVELKQGEWVLKHGIYVCSECDATCPYDVIADEISYWACNYCPHCGAKMDGEKALKERESE